MKRWLRPLPSIIAVFVALYVGVVIGYAQRSDEVAKTVQTAPTQVIQPPTTAELLTLVNAERAKNGVAPLTEDARLDASAQYKASDMAIRHYFSHFDPVTGKDSHDMIFSTGINCVDSSENIVWNVDGKTHKEMDNTSLGSVNAWIASPPHHKAMIDAKYSLTGFGISGDYVVEHFCQQ